MMLIYTTCKNKEEAERIADGLLENKLAVCCKMWNTQTRYLWKGNKESADEAFLLIETSEAKKDMAEKRIKELHSYETPVIVGCKTDFISSQTQKWMEEELAESIKIFPIKKDPIEEARGFLKRAKSKGSLKRILEEKYAEIKRGE